MTKKKAIVFDWDGTLLDSMTYKRANFIELFEKLGVHRELAEASHRRLSGLPRKILFQKAHLELLGRPLEDSDFQKLSEQYSRMNIESGKRAPLFPDAIQAIQKLKDHYTLFISSSAAQEELDQIVPGKEVAPWVREFWGSRPGFGKGRDHIAEIEKLCGVSRSEIIMVGDDEQDLHLAHDAQVDGLRVVRNPETSLAANEIRSLVDLMPKEVLIYSGHCEIVGGDGKYIIDLINHLPKSRLNVRMITDAHTPMERRLKEWLKTPLDVTYLDTAPNFGQASLSERLSRALFKGESPARQKLRRLSRFALQWLTFDYLRQKLVNVAVFRKVFSGTHAPIDLFWFNNGGYPGKEAGLISIILARLFRIPTIVMTFHNVPAQRAWYRPSDFIYDFFVSRFCNVIIAVSENLKRDLVAMRGYPASKVHVLYCGLEDAATTPEAEVERVRHELGATPGTCVLLIVGTLDEERKGHSFLLQALSQIPLSRRSSIVLWIVGGGTNESVQKLRNHVSRLGLEKSVSLLGHRTDIMKLNDACDIAVIPSLDQEALPYTIKEAARASKPAITTSAGGCAEGVENGLSGIIVEPGDVASLKNAIETLVSNEALRKRMGSEGRKTFEKRFQLQKQVQNHLLLFDTSR